MGEFEVAIGERVRLFIAGYSRAHQLLHAEDFEGRITQQFTRWAALIADLDAEHGVNRGCMALAGVIHGKSPHVPGDESVSSVRHGPEATYVETIVTDVLAHYYEYELRHLDGDWRIARIKEFLRPADALFMTDRERPRFASPAIIPPRELPANDLDADGDAVFAVGRQVTLKDRTSRVEVRSVGRLNVTTGRLVVGDLGYDAGVLGVIGQCVPPGEYAAEVAIAFDRNAALRVRFSDEPVARWIPADHNRGSAVGYVVGVDAGNVAIMDLAAVMTVKYREKESAFDSYVENESGRYVMLSLAHEDDTVVADSGWGDGGYPVYWGIDCSDRPVVLVVDFMLFPRGRNEDKVDPPPVSLPASKVVNKSASGLTFIKRFFGGK